MSSSLFHRLSERCLLPLFRGFYIDGAGKKSWGNCINNKSFAYQASSNTTKRFYRTAVCTEFGKPLLIQNKQSSNNLRPGKIRVQVSASGINFGDMLIMRGQYQLKIPPPFTPGSEFAGTVLEVAEDVKDLKSGTRVAGRMLGAFSEEIIGTSDVMWEIPDSMSFEEAASFVFSYGTAFMGLKKRANLQAGETVLVTAAAGATGLAAIDLASHVFESSTVIGACGSEEKCELIKQRGANHAINYKKEEIKSSVMNISPHGADVIFEAVGGKIFKECLRSIAWEGRLLVVGFASGEIPKIPANHLLVKNASAVGLLWGSYNELERKTFDWSIQECMRFYKEGKIKPYYSAAFPLDRINDAFQFIKDRKSTGKVIITMR